MRELTQWTLCFRQSNGLQNRATILEAVTKFLQSSDCRELVLDGIGICTLFGETLDGRCCDSTSNVKTIRRMSIDEYTPHRAGDDIDRLFESGRIHSIDDLELFAIRTENNEYCVLRYEMAKSFQKMLDDSKWGNLSPEPGYYYERIIRERIKDCL